MTGHANEVDELQYDWPANVLRYESRYLFA
jgi:hypothetical protein